MGIELRYRLENNDDDLQTVREREASASAMSQSTADQSVQSHTISDTANNLRLGSVSTPGVAWVKNRAANSSNVTIGGTNGSGFLPVVELKPGESFPFRLHSGLTPQARAETGGATPTIDYWINAD